jgi:hypothetical protein
MERRLFVKRTALLSSLALVASPSALLADEAPQNEINISPLLSQGNNLKITGLIIDSESKKAINATIEIKTGYGIFGRTKRMNTLQGGYAIKSKMSKNDNKKVKITIEAEGYKTYQGHLYLNGQGCAIHTDMWKYNPKFNAENIPQNKNTSEGIHATFNIPLVKTV